MKLTICIAGEYLLLERGLITRFSMIVHAIDFDGVVHDYKNPVAGKRMGVPIEGTKSALNLLKARGDKVIIHTVKATTEGGAKAVRDWMIYYEIPFDEITAIKPTADFYLDDRAIRFTKWKAYERAN